MKPQTDRGRGQTLPAPTQEGLTPRGAVRPPWICRLMPCGGDRQAGSDVYTAEGKRPQRGSTVPTERTQGRHHTWQTWPDGNLEELWGEFSHVHLRESPMGKSPPWSTAEEFCGHDSAAFTSHPTLRKAPASSCRVSAQRLPTPDCNLSFFQTGPSGDRILGGNVSATTKRHQAPEKATPHAVPTLGHSGKGKAVEPGADQRLGDRGHGPHRKAQGQRKCSM